jgi:predicted DNA-binding protein with PD1-like motif
MSKMKTNIASLFLSKMQTASVRLYNKVTPIMRNYTFRLAPGQDLFDSIEAFVKAKQIEAGCVLSGVGSLTHARIRLADRELSSEYGGPFEIVSLTGTVSIHGSHLHISISDGEGRTIGGHFESGCRIYTTAEIVLAAFHDVIYKREFAEDSGYEELTVYAAGTSQDD